MLKFTVSINTLFNNELLYIKKIFIVFLDDLQEFRLTFKQNSYPANFPKNKNCAVIISEQNIQIPKYMFTQIINLNP